MLNYIVQNRSALASKQCTYAKTELSEIKLFQHATLQRGNPPPISIQDKTLIMMVRFQ